MDNKRKVEEDDAHSTKSKKTEIEAPQDCVKKPPLEAYTKHMMLIKQYLLDQKGEVQKPKSRTSKVVTDLDVLKANHKFLWDDEDQTDTWEKRVARKYYDKLFKEYCIADLKRYKENKIALRWRIEKEVIDGKGQFICADVNCTAKDLLKSWEVNFAYIEHGEKKNALVKIRLCPDCSYKLNYHHKRKEVKKNRKDGKNKSAYKETDIVSDASDMIGPSNSSTNKEFNPVTVKEEKDEDLACIWSSNQPQSNAESESIETEMDEYLSELFM